MRISLGIVSSSLRVPILLLNALFKLKILSPAASTPSTPTSKPVACESRSQMDRTSRFANWQITRALYSALRFWHLIAISAFLSFECLSVDIIPSSGNSMPRSTEYMSPCMWQAPLGDVA